MDNETKTENCKGLVCNLRYAFLIPYIYRIPYFHTYFVSLIFWHVDQSKIITTKEKSNLVNESMVTLVSIIQLHYLQKILTKNITHN